MGCAREHWIPGLYAHALRSSCGPELHEPGQTGSKGPRICIKLQISNWNLRRSFSSIRNFFLTRN